tara:strand:- start:1301 stop:1447 length:147 start_codon:yes stop_codon:yes gene_type:complete
MKPLSLEALIFYCAKQLADEEAIEEELLYELYVILKIHFEDVEKVTLH